MPDTEPVAYESLTEPILLYPIKPPTLLFPVMSAFTTPTFSITASSAYPNKPT